MFSVEWRMGGVSMFLDLHSGCIHYGLQFSEVLI